MDKEEDFPDHYTFSQRYGYEPLPDAMKLELLSFNLRRELCNLVVKLVKDSQPGYNNLYGNDKDLFQSVLGEFSGISNHKVPVVKNNLVDKIDDIMLKSVFHRVLTFLEILLRQMSYDSRNNPYRINEFMEHRYSLEKKVQQLFVKHGAAYRLVTNRGKPIWFFPCDSEENAQATVEAIETLHEGRFDGATTHLRKAADSIICGNHDNAIVHSIHAVESVARKINPDANTLGKALDTLRDRELLNHSALSEAFKKLYGYTSNEEGLRHSLIDNEEADVGQDESVFMFGACAAFAGYLVRKHLSSRNG
ncbi:MAG: hypothetical protein OXH65_00535 [Paracoccaceae bacterium]|nr:hypothetical protein [Paracoccaceae bacterium]MYJ86831.1 hypothetical protein [Paracoccaceae bacterium]